MRRSLSAAAGVCRSVAVRSIGRVSASGRDRQTMALSLRNDLEAIGHTVRLHSSVAGFLETVSHGKIETLEKEVICDEVVKCATTLAREFAAERATRFEFGEQKLTIKGYATPTPSRVAVAFEVSFDLRLLDQEGSRERQVDTTLTLDGSCSYDPVRHETTDVFVKSWSHSVKNQKGYHWGQRSPDPAFHDQMAQTRYV
jgi:hypothetical protein